jgi:L-threonylcarbamoyladenylate synthase
MSNIPDDSLLAEAVATLRRGALVAFPTETVYGLGADASNEAAVRRIFAAKGRPHSHPLIVHVATSAGLHELSLQVPETAELLAARFWPGPLTLVLRRGARVLPIVTGGQETVALRVPHHPLALALLRSFPSGLAAPSANRFGSVSPTSAEHVRQDLGNRVAVVLDGGPCRVGVESTIVDVSRGAPRLLRPGGVPAEAIEEVLGANLARESAGAVRVPGQLPSHYAPRAELVLTPRDELAPRLEALRARGAKIGLLAPLAVQREASGVHARVSLPDEPEGYARGLYAGLRELDANGVDVIAVVAPAERGLGVAVMDRLERAAAPRS